MNVCLSAARLLMRWTVVVPVVALAALAATWGSKPGTAILAIVGVIAQFGADSRPAYLDDWAREAAR